MFSIIFSVTPQNNQGVSLRPFKLFINSSLTIFIPIIYCNDRIKVNLMKDIKILVVDDVTSMRNVTKSILMVAEYTNVAQATDGVKALELLEDDAGLFVAGS